MGNDFFAMIREGRGIIQIFNLHVDGTAQESQRNKAATWRCKQITVRQLNVKQKIGNADVRIGKMEFFAKPGACHFDASQ